MKSILKYLLVAAMAATLVLVLWAVSTTPEINVETIGDDLKAGIVDPVAVGWNLYWGYALLAVAIVSAIFAAVWDMAQKPESIMGTVISLVVVVAVVVIAWFVASGHTYQIVDLQNQSYFARLDTVITDASILVTYVVAGGAIVAAIYSAVSDALK